MNTVSESAYSGDLVTRLRNWRGLHLAHGGELFDEAAAEIERLRAVVRRIAEQDCTLAIVNGVIYADDDEVCPTAGR